MKRLLIPFIALLSISSFAQQPPTSTPETSVKKFLEAFNALDIKGASSYVLGAKPNADYVQLKEQMDKTWPIVSVAEFDVKIDGTSAKASYTLEIQIPAKLQSTPPRPNEKLKGETTLKLVDGLWKIVPAANKQNSGPDLSRQDLLGMVALIISDPAVMAKARGAAMTTSSLSNVKQIGLGCLILANDYDGIFKIDPSNARKALAPYLKNDNLWFYPGDKSGIPAYSFNHNLAKVAETQLKDPSKVVLVYQGSKGKLKFVDGKAAVAFADGHAKNITPDQEKTLIWKP